MTCQLSVISFAVEFGAESRSTKRQTLGRLHELSETSTQPNAPLQALNERISRAREAAHMLNR
jgi:hypothetical protein